ncbi:hypothetical protein VYA_41080 (plasmid) [Vibrio alfacsensis]|nr:hypothetical protein [Vibrio sp. 04Ya108]BBM67744.1 hypothetical protein VA249_43900 [Vibrio alfacsensis]BCN26916.1 hypothetical protein VYA_41080 [Vibrio alfacsensis]
MCGYIAISETENLLETCREFLWKKVVASVWEMINGNYGSLKRDKVPGGWLVVFDRSDRHSLTFYPDPELVSA